MIRQAYAIETSDVSRYFGGRPAVRQVNLRVPESGIYGFLGLNGAGKTTTIRLFVFECDSQRCLATIVLLIHVGAARSSYFAGLRPRIRRKFNQVFVVW